MNVQSDNVSSSQPNDSPAIVNDSQPIAPDSPLAIVNDSQQIAPEIDVDSAPEVTTHTSKLIVLKMNVLKMFFFL